MSLSLSTKALILLSSREQFSSSQLHLPRTPLRIRPTDSRSPFLRIRLMRELKPPEAKAERPLEEKVAVVVAVAVEDAEAVVEEERAVTDLLVKVVIAVKVVNAVRVVTAAREVSAVEVTADLALKVVNVVMVVTAAREVNAVMVVTAAKEVNAVEVTADPAKKEIDNHSKVEEEVDTEDIPEKVATSLLMPKDVLLMSDLLALRAMFSVATVVDTVVAKEADTVVAVVDSEVEREETMVSEVAAAATEAATSPDLSMDTTPREVVIEEVVPAQPEVPTLLLSDSKLLLIRKFEC
jgi:hypothetical protein